MTADERIAALLRERGATEIEHPGGTLYDHLERVQQRLADLGAPTVVQLAGRAHAVYGTDGFDVVLLTLRERSLLADIAGPDVEALVHRYGGCDRDRTWDALASTRRVRSRFTGDSEVLDDEDVRAFAVLSLVNELDVAEHSPDFVDRHGAYFRRLTTAWESLLTPAVVAESHRILG
jgi:hypothetical protein